MSNLTEMTLRDFLAAHCVAAFKDTFDKGKIAKEAYEMADQMIQERGK